MMPYLYYCQLAVSDYFSQYYESNNSNKNILCHYVHWSTMLFRWLEKNVEELSGKLEREFPYKIVHITSGENPPKVNMLDNLYFVEVCYGF